MTPRDQLRELITKLSEISDALPLLDTAPLGASASIVTAKKAGELTGYTDGQLEGRRRDGTHAQGVIWWHDGKGSIVYDVAQLEEWMRTGWHREKPITPASSVVATHSESGLSGKAKESTNHTLPRRRLRA